MAKRSVFGGKVMHTPDYDERRVPTELSAADVGVVSMYDTPGSFKVGIYSDGERTWARDKALLVALGVDGDVPLAQAMVNAGLAVLRMREIVDVGVDADGWVLRAYANDNEIAAKAA